MVATAECCLILFFCCSLSECLLKSVQDLAVGTIAYCYRSAMKATIDVEQVLFIARVAGYMHSVVGRAGHAARQQEMCDIITLNLRKLLTDSRLLHSVMR